MTKRAVIIQHHPVETLAGNFTAVLRDAGFAMTTAPVFAGAPDFVAFDAPDVTETDLIIALGGPMSANDNYPALIQEMAYLRAAATGDVGNRTPTPVVGICLGAQLLSRALGGAVAPTGGYQFGLRKIDVTDAGASDTVFREIGIPLVPTLHGERFTVPSGATLLAEGTMLRRDGGYVRFPMAFRYGPSYAFQFEPQLTLDELRIWNRELAGDYNLMGDRFNPGEEAARNLREFSRFRAVSRGPDGPDAAYFADTSRIVVSPRRARIAVMQHLFYPGDNLDGLRRIAEMGITVDLVYIDPPFATNNEFLIDDGRANAVSASGRPAYSDTVRGDAYLDALRLRLHAIREVMSPTGSIYVHIDVKMEHHVRLLMDDIFGPENFRNSIARIKCNPKNFDRYSYGNVRDTILFYSVSPGRITWHPQREPLSDDEVARLYPFTDDAGRRYTTTPLHAPGITANGPTGQSWRGMPPPPGRHWRYPPARLDELDAAGLIEWSADGQSPENPLRQRGGRQVAAGCLAVQRPPASGLSHAKERADAGTHHPHLVRPGRHRAGLLRRQRGHAADRLRVWVVDSSEWMIRRRRSKSLRSNCIVGAVNCYRIAILIWWNMQQPPPL